MPKHTKQPTPAAPVTPHTFFTAAAGFHQAAAGLLERPMHDGLLLWPAILLNLCYAVELGCKSYLLATGADEADCKQLGHDLLAAFDEAQRRKLGSEDPEVRELIAILSPMNLPPFELRYLRHQMMQVPLEGPAVATVRTFMNEVSRSLNRVIGFAEPASARPGEEA